MNTSLALPIQICKPRCFVIDPSINRFQATTKAGAHGEKSYRLSSIFKRGTTFNVRLIQRRLIPFWSIRCASRFHYDRSSSYLIQINDKDTVELTMTTTDGQEFTLPVNSQSNTRTLTVNGKERCVTSRDVSEFIEAYQLPEAKSKILNPFGPKDNQGQFQEYLSNPTIPVSDIATLYQNHTIDGQQLYNDLQDENIQIVLPDLPANRVVGDVMKKVMVSIEPIKIHDWSLAVEVADLYFRPVYIFEFERLDKEKNLIENKLEQLDAITGEWVNISSREVIQPGRIPWDKIMHLTIDASVVVLQELGGPWVRVTAGLVEVSVDQIPDIVDDLKGVNSSENSPKK